MGVRKVSFPEDLEAQLEEQASRLGLTFSNLVKLACHQLQNPAVAPVSAPVGPRLGPNGTCESADTGGLGPISAPSRPHSGPIAAPKAISDPERGPPPSGLPLPFSPALAVAVEQRSAAQRSGGKGGEGEGGEGAGPPPPANGNGHAKAARDALREAELRWRVEHVWAAHVTAWAAFWREVSGRVPARRPVFVAADHGKPIREALLEFDRDLLGPDQREEWARVSTVRAAGVGIFYDPWCAGRAAENNAASGGLRYLEHWRPWRRQRGKGSPVQKFAELYFEQRDAIEALETADA